ncbi:MAG: hypothetical protein Q9222_002399 [Ikaeria aurantiellina]
MGGYLGEVEKLMEMRRWDGETKESIRTAAKHNVEEKLSKNWPKLKSATKKRADASDGCDKSVDQGKMLQDRPAKWKAMLLESEMKILYDKKVRDFDEAKEIQKAKEKAAHLARKAEKAAHLARKARETRPKQIDLNQLFELTEHMWSKNTVRPISRCSKTTDENSECDDSDSSTNTIRPFADVASASDLNNAKTTRPHRRNAKIIGGEFYDSKPMNAAVESGYTRVQETHQAAREGDPVRLTKDVPPLQERSEEDTRQEDAKNQDVQEQNSYKPWIHRASLDFEGPFRADNPF